MAMELELIPINEDRIKKTADKRVEVGLTGLQALFSFFIFPPFRINLSSNFKALHPFAFFKIFSVFFRWCPESG